MKTKYINCIILDGTLDMQPVEGLAIVVENNKIVDILPQNVEIDDCVIVDLQGQYILPGLINLHAHLPGTGKPTKRKMNLELICKVLTSCALGRKIGCSMILKNTTNAVMAGVTTLRSVGGVANFDSVVRDKINKGEVLGPHILTSNSAIATAGGHMAGSFATAVGDAKEAVELVEKMKEDSPDLIKLMITGGVMDCDSNGEPGSLKMSQELINSVCSKAHELGLPVAAHCEGTEGVKLALLGGVDTIEHGAKPTDEIVTLFKERDASQVVTISPALPYKLRLKGVMNISELAVKNSGMVVDGMVELAKRNLAEGVKVGLGTDSSCSYVTHYDFWRELEYFVKFCGVSNSFALHTATLVNARIAGIEDETGSIEVGKRADMIVVKDNPLLDLSTLRNVTKVIINGSLIEKPVVEKYPEVEEVLNSIVI